MDFLLTDEQLELQALARQILADHTGNDQLREIEKGEENFDAKLWSNLAEAGLLGAGLPEAHGGMDFGFESLCLLVEAVGETSAPIPVIPVLVSGALPIARFGSEAQQSRWLPGVADGSTLVSAALIEAGSEDPRRPATRARRDAEGWRVSGEKFCVPFAHRAERIVMPVAVEGEDEGRVAVLLLDPRAKGVSLDAQESTAGEPWFQITLRDVAISDADCLAGVDEGAKVIDWIVARTTAAVCAQATGLVARATRMTAEYTSQREQFGVKIATFQAVGQRAANCYVDSQCLQLVTQQAVSLLDREREAEAEVLIAKIWAGDVAHRVSHAAQHLHGGIGVDRDYPLFRYCLWARQLELTLGSSAENLARLGESVAREFAAA